MTRTKGEADFINEMTRKLLGDWGHQQILTGELKKIPADQAPYVEHAKAKSWLKGKTGEYQVSSSGFKVAAAFLRR
jgi:hypothetical protein